MKRLLWLLLAVDLLGLGAVLWDGQRHLGQASRHEDMLRSVGDVHTAVVQLNEQVLGARAGVVAHYDGVVMAGCAVDAAATHLHNIIRDPCLLPQQAARLQQHLADLDTILETQRGLVEHIKSELSVLRNSQRYLPVVVKDLSAAGTPGPLRERRAAALQDVLRSLLVFAVQPSSVDATRVEDAITNLSLLGEDLPAAEKETLALTQRHARVVLERRQMVDSLVGRLLRIQVRERTQRVREEVLAHRAQADSQAGTQLRVAAGQGALALLLGMLLLWRTRRPSPQVTPAPDATPTPQGNVRNRLLLGVCVRNLEDAQAALSAVDVARGLKALEQRVGQLAAQHGWEAATLGPGLHVMLAPNTQPHGVAALLRAWTGAAPLEWEAQEPMETLAVLHHGPVLRWPGAPPGGHGVQLLLRALLGQDLPHAAVVCTPQAATWLEGSLPLEPHTLTAPHAPSPTTPLQAVRLG